MERELSLPTKILLGCVPALVVVLLAEVVVRATGAADHCSARFSKMFVCDPILGYRLDPELRPYGKPLNSAGFRAREFTDKPEGVYRIVSLGDSCTFGVVGPKHVPVPYPDRLEQIAARHTVERQVEAINAGLPGYNSYHGVMLLRTKLRRLEPDLITVRYGWNDLFLFSSVHGARLPTSSLGLAVEGALLRTAVYRFLRRVGHELRAKVTPLPERVKQGYLELTEYTPAVPLLDFERHLRLIVEIGRSRGAEVLLLTSSRNPAPSDEAVRKLVSLERLTMPRLIEIHESYNQAVRDVGAELGVDVLDMAEIYQKLGALEAASFIPMDIPHPNQAGHNVEALALCQELRKRRIVSACQLPRGV